MHKNLILLAYKKAKEARKKIGDNKPSSIKISEDISDYIDELTKLKLNERTYRVYYSEAKKITEKEDDINISQLRVIYGLCKYLGFETYEDFVASLSSKENDFGISKDKGSNKQENPIRIWSKKNKIMVAAGIILLAFFLIKVSMHQQRWMVWEHDHYVEVKFDLDKYDLGQLKIYKEERVKSFKKINSPDCNTQFFNEKQKPIVWYSKENNKEIELFTDFGLHPTTGKTLKPITEYMITKYVCSN